MSTGTENKRPSVLIVDDVPENIDVLKNILLEDYKVRAANGGRKALDIIFDPEKRPDLVLCDVMMPEVDGYEVLKQMKEEGKTADIPLIFVTAMGEQQDEQKGLDLGAVDYITKPVVPSLVKARVFNQIKLLEQKREAQELASQLSRYLSPAVGESLANGKSHAEVGAKRKKLTVFFLDIVNFTSRTDRMEPEDLTSRLNTFLESMTNIALKHGGTVDKYIGDSVMVFFGDPKSKGVVQDAVACVEMALEMQTEVEILAEDWGLYGGTPLQVRMGIATGYCTVGNFGSDAKLEYTIVGNTVNLASRMEENAGPGEIFVDQECWNLVRDRFSGKSMGLVSVKGFVDTISVYRIEGGEVGAHLKEEDIGFKININFDEVQDKSKIRRILESVQRKLEES